MKINRPPWCTARAIADRLPLPAGEQTDLRINGRDVDLEPLEHIAGFADHPRFVDGKAAARLAAEEDVVGDVALVDQGQVLVDDRDPQRHGFVRAANVYRLPIELDLSLVRVVSAAEDFHEGRFAGAVVTDERDRLAGVDAEIDVLQRLHMQEGLADPARLQQRELSRAVAWNHSIDPFSHSASRCHP